MAIGNLSSKICQMPSVHIVVMVTLLPIQMKNRDIPQMRMDDQWETIREMLNNVLWQVMQPLACKYNLNAESRYYNALCADGNFTQCKLVLAAWRADWLESSDQHHLEQPVCFWCQCRKNELGDYVPLDRQYPRCDHNLYGTLSDTNTKATDAELSVGHVLRCINVYRDIPCIVNDFPKPDLLRIMQICIPDHQ